MPLVFRFDFNSISIDYAPFCGGSINQLLAILKGNSKPTVHLNPLQFGKFVNRDGFFYSICFVLRINGIGRNFELSFHLRSGRNQLSFEGCKIAIFINNSSFNSWPRQFFVNPYNPFICIGLLNLNKSVIWETLIRALIPDFGNFVVVNPWVFLDMNNGKIPVSQAIFRNKRFA